MKMDVLSKRDTFLKPVIVATVIEADPVSTNEKCGFEVGDKLIFTGTEILGRDKYGKEFPGPVCYSLIFPLLSNIFVMEHGGRFPWEKESCITACPDAKTRVVFEMRRYDKETGEEIPPGKSASLYMPSETPGRTFEALGKKGKKMVISPPKDSPLSKILAGRSKK